MTIQNKLVEDFRAKIKSIFKESADAVDKKDELDQRPDANGKPTMPPKPKGPIPVLEEEGIPPAEVAPDVGAEAPPEGGAVVPPVEEEKVTLSVSLLKSLLDWAHGEEETEEGGEEDASGLEDAAAGISAEPEVAPVTEEEEVPEVAPEGGEVAPEAGEEEMEDPGVEAIEIQALVDKVKELAQTKGELTDEDFGEIVAAAEAAEGGAEGEGEGLEGVLDGEGAGSELPAAPEVAPVTENIGQIVPPGINNKGNNGLKK